MNRVAIALLLLAGSAAMALEPAYGQVVQYQSTPPPPIVPLGSGSGSGLLQLPPPISAQPLPSQTPSYVPVPGGPAVVVPPAPPGENTFSDRVSRCIQAGSAAGLGPGQIGTFTGQCAN
jgi:hypothetical protein